MRKLALILLFISGLAHAQYFGGYLPKTGGTISGNLGIAGTLSAAGDANVTGNVNVKGTLSSTANIQPAGVTNSGVAIGGGPNYGIVSIFDSTQTANNRTAQIVYFQGATQFRVASDDGATAPAWLSAAGGQASGITGITSNSGSGTWAHTGSLTVTNYVGSLDTGTLPGFSGSSGAFLYAGNGFESLMLQRAGNTAGNRRAYVGFTGAGVALGFFNDQSGTQTPAITVAGGAASGITGITSTSGTGSWTHTGDMAVSGTLTAGSGTLNVYSASGAAVTTPHMVTGTVTLASGAATATFTGDAIFSSSTSYNCTANDTTTNAAVKVAPATASSASFEGATTDVIAYQCIGN